MKKMKHHLSVLLVLGSICILNSCKKEISGNNENLITKGAMTSLSENKSISESTKNNDTWVPFTAHFETASTPLAFPPILRLETTGTGIGSHIGKATLLAYPTIRFTTPPPFAVSGTLVITAANGDEIFASFTGTRSVPDAAGSFTINATYTITGGSGRFQDATGSFVGISMGKVGIHTGTASYEGYISY